MAERDDSHQDKEVFDKTLQELMAQGVDRRIAEGRARRAAALAYRKVHGEPERPAAARPAAAAAAGDGGGNGGGAPAAAAVAAPPGGMYVPPPAAAVRTAPPPTGRVPSPKAGQPDKHRLLALVA